MSASDRRAKRQEELECILKVLYELGALPIKVDRDNHIKWTIEDDQIDFSFYLPIFMEGIREKTEPYRSIAIEGVSDLI